MLINHANRSTINSHHRHYHHRTWPHRSRITRNHISSSKAWTSWGGRVPKKYQGTPCRVCAILEITSRAASTIESSSHVPFRSITLRKCGGSLFCGERKKRISYGSWKGRGLVGRGREEERRKARVAGSYPGDIDRYGNGIGLSREKGGDNPGGRKRRRDTSDASKQ